MSSGTLKAELDALRAEITRAAQGCAGAMFQRRRTPSAEGLDPQHRRAEQARPADAGRCRREPSRNILSRPLPGPWRSASSSAGSRRAEEDPMNLQKLSRDVKLVVRGEMLVVHAKLAFAMRRCAVRGPGAYLRRAWHRLRQHRALRLPHAALGTGVDARWAWRLINMALALAAIGYAAVVKPGPGDWRWRRKSAISRAPRSRATSGPLRPRARSARQASTDRPRRFSCPRSPPSWRALAGSDGGASAAAAG